MHWFYLMLCSGNLVPLCQHSQEKAQINIKQVFKDKYEPPLALFGNRGNQCSEETNVP
jgi:hypothetical protein